MPRKAELTMIQDDKAHESGRRKPTMDQKVRNREREKTDDDDCKRKLTMVRRKS